MTFFFNQNLDFVLGPLRRNAPSQDGAAFVSDRETLADLCSTIAERRSNFAARQKSVHVDLGLDEVSQGSENSNLDVSSWQGNNEDDDAVPLFFFVSLRNKF